MLRRLLSRLRHLLRPGRSRRELDEEMAFHVDRLLEDLVRQGMDPKEARREARIRFGSPERVQSRAREERGLALVDETARNLRLAFRGMARSPLFSATFVLVLALCIGLGTAVFSVADAVLWKPLPYPSPDRLANVTLYDPALSTSPFDIFLDGRAWERVRDREGPFDIAVYSDANPGVNLTTDERATYVRQQRVGAGYFGVLGVPPLMGREFLASEDLPGGPAVAVLSHGLWTNAFGNEPVLGETVRIKGEAHTVVGIMPPGFRPHVEADLWTPLRATTTGEGGGSNYAAIARISEGVTLAEADARLESVEPPDGGTVARAVPEGTDTEGRRFGLIRFGSAQAAEFRFPLLLLMGAGGLMLLVGCTNLAGLQVARALARAPEMATRQALGSGAGALARQVVTENLLLGIVGGALGLVLAHVGIGAVEGVFRSSFGLWQEIEVGGRAVLTAAAITVFATVVFGLMPVVQARSAQVRRLLVSGSRVVGEGGHGLRKVLLIGQVAMVTVLLFVSGLLVRSYEHLEGLDPGFAAGNVLTVQFSLDDARYRDTEAVNRLFDESLDGIRRMPGVASAAVSLTLPYERALNTRVGPAGDDTFRLTNFVYVTPGYFETLRIPLLQGRAIGEGDRPGAPPVAVANEAWVAANLEDRDAVGSLIEEGFFGSGPIAVVGVVGNVQQAAGWGSNTQPVWETPTVYVPAAQTDDRFLRQVHTSFPPSWIVRGTNGSTDLAAEVRSLFATVDPELPVARVSSLEEVMSDAFARQRLEASFLLAVAGFALLLAGIGLYGIVAHEVLERRTEIGLRMALGSSPGRAVWAVGIGGVRLALAGLAVGVVVAIGVGRVIQGMIWGITPYDPATLAALVVVLATLAGVASFVPAARVSRMDPARVLREA